jgi:hypothetical protein
MSRWDFCGQCRRRLGHHGVVQAPMLIDATWLRFASKRDLLCSGCMFDRAKHAGVALTFADLRACAFNLLGRPSWFDLFLSLESSPPPNLEAWRAVKA